jgi:hypothetical protein
MAANTSLPSFSKGFSGQQNCQALHSQTQTYNQAWELDRTEYKKSKKPRLGKSGDTQAGTQGSVSRFQEGVVLRCSARQTANGVPGSGCKGPPEEIIS